MNQLSLYDIAYEKFKITKPIRLIELFAGYGSQALALKYLGVDFEHWKICEWAIKSIQAYKDIHFTNDDVELNPNRTKEDMINFLYQTGISNNYNDPMTKEQISRLSEEQLKTIIKNIAITHNLVNIQQVKGKDLEIVNTDKYDYIMTYSFPCQDLSLAGKGKGMSDVSTRSGMLWEVERILSELDEKPKILLMENVPQVHSVDNLEDFNKWKLRLEELGYTNYFQDLIATDYGIPQTRNRCFMVSLLGDYSYIFPKPIPLKLKLKDILEEDIDEKYYLSDKMINYFTHNEEQQKENGNGFRFNVSDGDMIAKTITTRAGSRMDDNFIKIKNATKQGYLEASEGDGIDLLQPNSESRRGRVQKDTIQTLDTVGGNGKGVVVNSPKIIDDRDKGLNGINIANNCPTQRATRNGLKVLQSDLRIRKLTPRECFRLMGVKDQDYNNVCKKQSDSSLYHLAGDSIVVNVLMAIFGEML